MSTRDVGTNFEELAIRHLSQFGLELIAQNYRLNNGEIDVIMQDDDFIVFIEVKYRATTAFADVLEQISAKQLQRVRHSARVWLAKNELSEHTTPCRFDIIAITGHPFNIEWLKDAF